MFIPSCVKTVQYFSCAFAGGSPTADAVLPTPVVVANSMVIVNGYVNFDNSNFINSVFHASSRLISTNTVRATAIGNPSVNSYLRGVVIEFYGAFVKSSGYDEITLGNAATSATKAIAVTKAKTFLHLTGCRANGNGVGFTGGLGYTVDELTGSVDLTSDILVTARWQPDTNFVNIINRVVAYNWIEFR